MHSPAASTVQSVLSSGDWQPVPPVDGGLDAKGAKKSQDSFVKKELTPASKNDHLEFLERRFPYLSDTSARPRTATANSSEGSAVSQKMVKVLLVVNENRERRARSFDKVSYGRLATEQVDLGKEVLDRLERRRRK